MNLASIDAVHLENVFIARNSTSAGWGKFPMEPDAPYYYLIMETTKTRTVVPVTKNRCNIIIRITPDSKLFIVFPPAAAHPSPSTRPAM
jgi:hypothetical protein